MLSFLLLAGLVVADPEPTPVAMILEMNGGVRVKPGQGDERRASPMQVLFRGDRVITGDEGQIVIVLFKDKRRERVGAKREVTIRAEGCHPEGTTEKLPAIEKKPVINGLDNLKVSPRGAFQLFRSEPAAEPPQVNPIPGTTVLSDRPSLVWLPHVKAAMYQLEVTVAGSGRRVWTARAKEAKLAYPKGEPSLRRGRKYEWRVVAEVAPDSVQEIVKSAFTVASEDGVRELSGLKELAMSKQPSDLLLAALAYQSAGVFEEALGLFEKLSALRPAEPEYLAARAEFYERAGRGEDAKKAWAEAKKLGYSVPDKKEKP
jgi:hypothetical protein